MRNSLPLSAALFGALVAAGAWTCDTLIQLTLPGDPCHDIFMWVTVAIFSVVFLLCMAYLGVLTIRVVEGRWVRGFRSSGFTHAVGCATLFFTAISPLIVLKGPKSSTTYGERVAVIEALEHVAAAKKAIESYWRENRHYPADLREAGVPRKPDSLSTAVGSMVSTQDGAITLTFDAPRYPNLHGRTLVVRPSHDDGGFRWDCRGGDIPDHTRPAQCRSESSCRVFSRWQAAR